MLKPTTVSVVCPVTELLAKMYRFECVDGNFVGLNVNDHVPSLLGVTVPSSVPPWPVGSPLSHTSIVVCPGSSTVPMMVNSDFADTFCVSVGWLMARVGAPPAAGAAGTDGAVEATAGPPPVTFSVSNHQPLPPVWAYTYSVWPPAGTAEPEITAE